MHMPVLPLPVEADPAARLVGMAAIARIAFEQTDVGPLASRLMTRLQGLRADPAALLDLSMILQSHGRAAEAMEQMQIALRLRRDYCVVHGDGAGPRLLAFVTPGDFMANTPLDFLLEGSNALLLLRFVGAETTALDDLPEHDVAFMAIGESPENAAVLARMAVLLADWPGPILNNAAPLIAGLTRDGVSARLANQPALYAPPNIRVSQVKLTELREGRIAPETLHPDLRFPLVLRPIGSHAGNGMRLAQSADDLHAPDVAEVYLAPFIDYRDAEGLFTKQRVVFIKGHPYPCHMARSDHWIVHYLSAGMAEDPAKRAAEAAWMADFETGFSRRHAAAFTALNAAIGLDYFGIDCAELPDGRLLVFELDVAMIVHDMDDAAIFPYKKPAMRRLFDAFLASLTSPAPSS
ncbi:MAG: hypothetical protein KGH84_09660 [Paracoccaceae bacterium]|nr:hypothetical protein [Paracoccaceae bacterium]